MSATTTRVAEEVATILNKLVDVIGSRDEARESLWGGNSASLVQVINRDGGVRPVRVKVGMA